MVPVTLVTIILQVVQVLSAHKATIAGVISVTRMLQQDQCYFVLEIVARSVVLCLGNCYRFSFTNCVYCKWVSSTNYGCY